MRACTGMGLKETRRWGFPVLVTGRIFRTWWSFGYECYFSEFKIHILFLFVDARTEFVNYFFFSLLLSSFLEVLRLKDYREGRRQGEETWSFLFCFLFSSAMIHKWHVTWQQNWFPGQLWAFTKPHHLKGTIRDYHSPSPQWKPRPCRASSNWGWRL